MSISKFGTTENKPSSTPKVIGIENKLSKTGDTMLGDLNLGGHSIKNVANPEEESDSVNKRFVENTISNYVRYEDSVSLGARLAVIGIDSDEKPISSPSPIQIHRSVITGLNTINRLPDTTFRIQTYPNLTAFIELQDSLILRGVATPVDATATKLYVDNSIRNISKFDVYRVIFNSTKNAITIEHIGGEGLLCTLDTSGIKFTYITFNLVQMSTTGYASNTSRDSFIKIHQTLDRISVRNTIKRFNIPSSSNYRLLNTSVVLHVNLNNTISFEQTFPSRPLNATDHFKLN